MKDLVTITDLHGTKQQVSNRYLLMTVSELHSAFSKMHPTLQIWRSSFSALRPSCCRLLGDMKKEVCVCTYHDNLEMMYKAIGISKYSEYFNILVCDAENKSCMHRSCPLCKDKAEDFKEAIRRQCQLLSSLQTKGVTFQQWCLTDRPTQVCNPILVYFIIVQCKMQDCLIFHRFQVTWT